MTEKFKVGDVVRAKGSDAWRRRSEHPRLGSFGIVIRAQSDVVIVRWVNGGQGHWFTEDLKKITS